MCNTETAAKVYATTETGWRVTSPTSTVMGFSVKVFAPGMPDDCPDAVFYGSLPEDAISNGMKFATHDALTAEVARLRAGLEAELAPWQATANELEGLVATLTAENERLRTAESVATESAAEIDALRQQLATARELLGEVNTACAQYKAGANWRRVETALKAAREYLEATK